MAVFKCKMCGGALEINNETIAVCQYCGTKQTLPKLDDDRKANLYDRANHFRRNNEFDKAMGIYEQILNEDNTDAESYWSLVLCRYGIEYVEDPTTHKRIPTVNRAQFTSIFDDEDYKSAIKYADDQQKELYENEATVINEIHKRILTISSQEEPFDVFICYKESDTDVRRTPDSVLATELYHELVREGFKVFFSRITLEDKLGQEYEPYIFAALNSAKVMVVLGTKPEYFNAVWVKNEWSRYLALIKNGARKILIPAYKDMDPYDLPEEFSHLQAQDMSKLGFMQDLIRGVKKVVSEETVEIKKETVVTNSQPAVAALLERAFMFLEDGDWQSADEYCEKVLDQDPKNARAYLGKLMAELKVNKESELSKLKETFENNGNYQKVIRFADNELKDFLVNCNKEIIYTQAKRIKGYALYEEDFKEAEKLFKTVSGYKDADTFAAECTEKSEITRKDSIYQKAIGYTRNSSIESQESAINLFESILLWKDSENQIALCKQRIEEIKAQEKAYVLECERKAEEKRIAKEKRKMKNRKITVFIMVILCVIIAFLIVLKMVIIPKVQYNKAVKLMSEGKYTEAIAVFNEVGDYKDVNALIKKCNLESFKSEKYDDAIDCLKVKNFSRAYLNFRLADNYMDSPKKVINILKQQLDNAKLGDIIQFGLYDYSNQNWQGQEKDVVRWIVLDKTENKILIFAAESLSKQKYSTTTNNKKWDNSELRKWLNEDFLKESFSEYEINSIIATNEGFPTKDKIFLLNDKETNKYFNLINLYAPMWGSKHTVHTMCSDDLCSWGLRTMANTENYIKIACHCCGLNAQPLKCTDLVNIRPALWIDLNALSDKE